MSSTGFANKVSYAFFCIIKIGLNLEEFTPPKPLDIN